MSIYCFNWSIDKTFIRCYHSCSEWAGNDGNERIFCFPQIYCIIEASHSGSLGKSYPSAAPTDLATRCWRLTTLQGWNSGYYAAPAYLDTSWWGLTLLQICSRFILQHQLTWPLVVGGGLTHLQRCRRSNLLVSADLTTPWEVLSLCRNAVGLFWSTSWLDNSLWGCVLLLCRDAVGLICSISRLDRLLGGLIPLQRFSRFILQHQLSWPLVVRGGGLTHL